MYNDIVYIYEMLRECILKKSNNLEESIPSELSPQRETPELRMWHVLVVLSKNGATEHSFGT